MDSTRVSILRSLQRDYGLGEPDARTAHLKRTVTNGTETIAEQLYATSTHFIMELVQNADDNAYEAGVNPYIQFLLRPTHLMVSNNERGFEEANVRAICSLSDSTKKGIQGSIGEKGIGFKAVFVWSDEPHVLSNGFDFKFKHKTISGNEVGFLVPYFPHAHDWPQDDLQFCRRDNGRTIFYLPFRAGGEYSRVQAVSQLTKQFKTELMPETVLFLRKLNSIRLWYPEPLMVGATVRVTYNRTTDDNGIGVSVAQSSTTFYEAGGQSEPVTTAHHYRKASHKLTVPHDLGEKRRDYLTTAITLAFPTKMDGLPNDRGENHVFAFLPVRSFGFKFVIQADFLLVANREDLMKEKRWNVWLRDSVPEAFMGMFRQIFQEDPNMQLQYAWVRYLPMDKDVPDHFFAPMIAELYRRLQNSACLMSASNEWRHPRSLVIPSPLAKRLNFGEVLRDMTAPEPLEFIHHKVSSGTIYSRQCMKLGAKLFDHEHLFRCLDAEYWVALEEHDDEWFIKLFACIHELIRPQDANTSNLRITKAYIAEGLWKKKIFPVQQTDVVLPPLAPLPQRLQDTPPDELRSDLVSLEYAHTCNNAPLFFIPKDAEGEFPPGLLVLSPAIGPSESLSTDFLELLGLKPATKFMVLMAVLGKVEEAANRMKTRFAAWSDEDHQAHIRQVLYILHALEELSPEERTNAIDQCRKQLFLHIHHRTAEARKQPMRLVSELYIHSATLENLFMRGGIQAYFVNTAYFTFGGLERDQVESLEDTLRDIGAAAGPKLKEVRGHLRWNVGRDFNWQSTQERYDVITHEPGDEMRRLIEHRDPKVHEELLVLMDAQWEYYRAQTETNLVRYQFQSREAAQLARGRGRPNNRPLGRGRGSVPDNRPPDGTHAVPFKLKMADLLAFEATYPNKLRRGLQQMLVPTSVQDLYTSRVQGAAAGAQFTPVCQTYQRSESLVRALGEAVPFLQKKLDNVALVHFLGIETQMSAEAVLKALVHLQERQAQGGAMPSVSQLARLYGLLSQFDEKDAKLIREYFHSHPLLLVDAVSPITQTPEKLMTTADLKIELRAAGVDLTGINEKHVLQDKLKAARREKRLRFATMELVRWSSEELSDPNLFGTKLHFLDRIKDYDSTLKRFFTRTLQIEKGPSADDLAKLLTDIISCWQAPQIVDRQTLLGITHSTLAVYAELHRVVQYSQTASYADSAKPALEHLATTPCFLSRTNVFYHANKIFVPDDQELVESFGSEVSLLKGNREEHVRCEEWLRFAGVKTLSSQCTTTVLHLEGTPPNEKLRQAFQTLIHAFARWTYIKDRKLFDRIDDQPARASGGASGWAALRDVHCFLMDEVQVEFTLALPSSAGGTIKKVIRRQCHIQNLSICLTALAWKDADSTAKVIADAFFEGSHTIQLLYDRMLNSRKLEQFLQTHGIGSLPENLARQFASAGSGNVSSNGRAESDLEGLQLGLEDMRLEDEEPPIYTLETLKDMPRTKLLRSLLGHASDAFLRAHGLHGLTEHELLQKHTRANLVKLYKDFLANAPVSGLNSSNDSPLLSSLGSVRVGRTEPTPPSGPTASPSMSNSGTTELAESVPEVVGASGEFFVFKQLQAALPDFVRKCWVSKLKLVYYPEVHSDTVNNELGADFQYFDRAGKLTGSGRSEMLFIEVKSMAQEAIGPFRMSINEWNLAKRCHESGGREVYVVAIVTSVTRAPQLSSLIVDPLQQVANRTATCEVSELVYAPCPAGGADGTENAAPVMASRTERSQPGGR